MTITYTIIADTHGLVAVDKLLEGVTGDVLIHCGDFACGDMNRRARHFVSESHRQSFMLFCVELAKIRDNWKHVICVPGNHDQICEAAPLEAKGLLAREAKTHLLIDESVTIDGINYYGLPWTPPFNNWFFNAADYKMRLACDAIPDDTNVLISHGPPYGFFDKASLNGDHLGSHILGRRVKELFGHHDLRAVFYGHIHGGGGNGLPLNRGNKEIVFVNASVLDEDYELRIEDKADISSISINWERLKI